jgi:hypothetical protein
MSYEAVRQIVEKRFFDTYSSADTDAQGAVVFLEGHDIVQPVDSPWIVLSVVDGGSAVRAFNKGMRKTSGFVRFSLFVSSGTGTKNVRQLADYIDNIMGFQGGTSDTSNPGNLLTHVGQLRKQTDDNDGYLKYVIDFDYDYYE